MKTPAIVLAPIVVVLLAILAATSLYTVPEGRQAIVTQFGRIVGVPVETAGLHVKTPFVQTVNMLEKRTLEWDGDPNQLPTRDKLFIHVDTYARWRIADPVVYFQRVTDERGAQSRLDDILDGETRNAVARHDLIEVIRSQNREPAEDTALVEAGVGETRWRTIEVGRALIAKEIFDACAPRLKDLGIELQDIRFKRIRYNADVQKKIYERMISERKQIAGKFMSEGQGEAARIRGDKERDLKQIASEAYLKVQEIQGAADAKAIEIYAGAYNASPQAAEFYRFLKTMETYDKALGKDTTVILSTGSEFFQFLKTAGEAAPAAAR